MSTVKANVSSMNVLLWAKLTDITVAQPDKIMYLVMDETGYKRYLAKEYRRQARSG